MANLLCDLSSHKRTEAVNNKVMDHHIEGRQGRAGKRGRYHHGDLRRDLLGVARKEIAEYGAGGISLAALARLAGVTQAAPYRHFADRDALLEAVATEAFQALIDRLRAAVSEQRSPEAARRALADAYVRFGEENIELYRLMFASGVTQAATDASALNQAAQDAFGLLRDTSAAGFSGEHRPERAIYLAWAQLHGLVMLKADGFITSALHAYVG